MNLSESVTLPDAMPTLRVMTRPNDANIKGDIFGGWLMSQIDIAGAVVAAIRAQGAVVTAAIENMRFLRPLYVHDVVSFYATLVRVGSSSLTVFVEVYAERLLKQGGRSTYRVSEATVVYVAVEEPGVKRKLPLL